MPEGAIYVGRPTKWGNPFVARDWQSAFRAVFLGFRGDRAGQTEAAVWLHRQWLTGEWQDLQNDNRTWFEREVMTVRTAPAPTLAEIRKELGGHDLCCWCPLDRRAAPLAAAE